MHLKIQNTYRKSSEGVTASSITVESRLKSRSYAAWSTLCDLSERGVAARTVYTSALRAGQFVRNLVFRPRLAVGELGRR